MEKNGKKRQKKSKDQALEAALSVENTKNRQKTINKNLTDINEQAEELDKLMEEIKEIEKLKGSMKQKIQIK